MVKIKEKYKQLSSTNKVLYIVSLVLATIVIVVSLCGLIGVVDSRISNYIAQPLMGIVIAINGKLVFKENKMAAIFSLCCAVIIFILYIITIAV